jgi:hypothetical protein
MEPGLNERLVPAADQRRFAWAARRRRFAQCCLWLACLGLDLALVPANGRTEPIDTEHLFAFTIGSDVGETGEKEVEGSVTGRFAKRSGTYVAGTSTLSVEYVPIPNLRTELTGVVNAYDITGATRHSEDWAPTSAIGCSIARPRRSVSPSAPSRIGAGLTR